MKTITKTFNIYSFGELSEEVQKAVVNKLSDINTDYEWWDGICEDANIIDCKIEGFDIDRGRYCKISKGDFHGLTTAKLILENHGEKSDTFKLATNFLSDGDNLENNDEIDENFDLLEENFREDLERDYLKILIDEYDYRSSEEQIIESIQANEYTFLEDGTIYN